MRYVLFCCFLCVVAMPGVASELPEEFGVDVTLVDGVFQDRGATKAPRSIWMSVRRVDGHWQPVLTLPDRVNAHFSLGFVRSAAVTPDAITLSVAFELADDPWVAGGWGFWSINLQRAADGKWQGTYDGEFADTPLSGAAVAEVHPVAQRYRPAAQAGEHPRLLLRQDDVATLSAKLQTEFGQAAAARLTNAPGLALQYILTGNKAFAEQSLAATKVIIADNSNGSKHVAHRVWGWRLLAVSLAFDNCYHAWSESDRAQVAAWLRQVVDRVNHQHQAWTEYTSFALGQRFGTNLVAAGAVGALVLLGEPGPAPTAPAPYLAGHDPRKALTQTAAFADDIPVTTFAPSTVPSAWNWVGGLFPADDDDVLTQLGGAAAEQFTLGQRITAGDGTAVVAALPQEAFRHGGVDVVKANKHTYFSDNWFATILRIDEAHAGAYRFDAGFDTGVVAGQAWIAGVPLMDKDVLTLGAGDYVLLIKAPCSQTNPWGMIQIKPRFVPLTAEEMANRLAHLDEIAMLRSERCAMEQAYHERTGADVAHWNNFAMSEGMVYANIRHFIRDGGFQTGAREPLFGWENMLRYPVLYRNAMGRDLSSFPDITHVLPRMVFTQIQGNDGAVQVQRINGRVDFGVKDWFDPERNTAAELFACLYPLAPTELQSGLHTAWHQSVGEGAAVLRSELGGGRHGVDFAALAVHPSLAFVHYPLDQPASSLADVMPHVWRADGLGWYGLRNTFADASDAVFQVYAKTWSHRPWERENAGAIRLAALGQDWWTGPGLSGPERFLESVPVIGAIAGHNPAGNGIVTDLHSGEQQVSVGIDLTDLWAQRPQADNGKKAEYFAGVGGQPRRERLQSSALTAFRQAAVDMSGVSGAPVVMIVVDRVRGGTVPTWRYHLDAITERYGRWEILGPDGKKVKKSLKQRYFRNGLPEGHRMDVRRYDGVSERYEPPRDRAQVRIVDNRFTVLKGDASMQGTVVGLGEITLREDVQESHYQLHQAKGNHHDYRMGSWSIFAEGSDTYLAVMTIQRGEAPAVVIEGDAAKATIRIGAQTATWDGSSIRFAQQ